MLSLIVNVEVHVYLGYGSVERTCTLLSGKGRYSLARYITCSPGGPFGSVQIMC